MPAGGQTTDTSTIGTWMVKKGDQVKRGDELLEVETDKATLAVESYANGTVLAILAESGDAVKAGTVIAYIGEESDMEEARSRQMGAVDDASPSVTEAPDTPAPPERSNLIEDEYQPIDKSAPPVLKTKSVSVKALPNAKLLARQKSVDLEVVAESVGKQILKRADVELYLSQIKTPEGSGDSIVPWTPMRRVIARRMLESTQNIPSFQVVIEVKMEQCIQFRKEVNESGYRISYNDILCKCAEAAIRKFPYMNASYSEDGIVLHRDVNVGLAVSVENGLVVPVVDKVNEKNIAEISSINKEHIQKARDGALTPQEMSGGTVTISNMGMYPVCQFNAVINPPEVCILAVAAVEDKPVADGAGWRSEPVMKVTGTFDHRVIDGAYAAQFLTEFKKIVENPALALL